MHEMKLKEVFRRERERVAGWLIDVWIGRETDWFDLQTGWLDWLTDLLPAYIIFRDMMKSYSAQSPDIIPTLTEEDTDEWVRIYSQWFEKRRKRTREENEEISAAILIGRLTPSATVIPDNIERKKKINRSKLLWNLITRKKIQTLGSNYVIYI